MKNWERALYKFIKDWQNRKEVLGAIVTGSYAVGNHTKFSDIDVHIVLSEKTKWRERGNKIVDGFLIEYFANPISQLKKYQEENYKNGNRIDARMFTIGKILFDKTGIVKKLQIEARKRMKKPFAKKDKTWMETKKYFLWDQLDNLHDLHSQHLPSFSFVYYTALLNIFETYAKFLRAEIPGPAKFYQVLTNDRFRQKYHIEKFPDQKFITIAKKCIEKDSLENIEKLTAYVLDKMGGFKIDGWKLKTPVEK